MLGLEPACADTQFQAAVAQVIDRGRHLRQDGRVTVRVAGNQAANADL